MAAADRGLADNGNGLAQVVFWVGEAPFALAGEARVSGEGPAPVGDDRVARNLSVITFRLVLRGAERCLFGAGMAVNSFRRASTSFAVGRR